MNARDKLHTLIQPLLLGEPILALTADTRTKAGLCAQLQRQLTEGARRLPAGGWDAFDLCGQLAVKAGSSRSARFYEQALRSLGRATLRPRSGDLLFSPYTDSAGNAWGHVGRFLIVDGEAYVLENTYANRGRMVLGSGPLRLTPYDTYVAQERITLVAVDLPDMSGVDPTIPLTLKRAATPAVKTPEPLVPAPVPPVKTLIAAPGTPTLEETHQSHVDALPALLKGKRLIVYLDGKTQPHTEIEKVTLTGDKLYIRARSLK
jgi:hypothetical protein